MDRRSTSKRSQSGQAIVIFTLMVSTVLVPMVGLAIDGGRGYLVRLKLSSAVDGGALAAARLLGTGANSAQQLLNAKATAAQFVNANFPPSFFGSSLSGAPTVCVDPGTDSSDPCKVGNGKTITTYKVRTVSVSATALMPTLFMRIIGWPTVTVASSGLASRRDVRVVLAIDRSSSMSGYYTGLNSSPPSINDMALKFVNNFSGSTDFGGRDEIGLVVFGGSAIVAYPPRNITKDYTDYTQFAPPDNNFKVSTNIPKYIGDIKNGSNTGTAEALYLSYMTLRADAATNPDLATKLNVIVLFTDGLPNGITAFANDPVAATQMMNAGCTNQNNGLWTASPLASSANLNMIGWFSQWAGFSNTDTQGAHGLHKPMMAYPYTGYTGKGDDIDAYMLNAGGDGGQISQMGGCTGDPMKTTMKQFPDRDVYGNYTDLSKVPSMPTGSAGQPLYKLGSLYSNQCVSSTYQATQASNACQIGLASWQATAHQAWKIWNQQVWDKTAKSNISDPGMYLSQPIIFTVGFDHSWDGVSEKPDLVLLQMIANDPLSPVSFSGRMKGQAYMAADPNAVDAAFQQIASQILRLSQ